MDPRTAWQEELEQPTEGFFPAFAARLREPDGLRDAVREAVKVVTPRVDWEGYLPQMPHGLLGLRAVFRLAPYLAEPSFLRLMAAQLHAFAHEPRSAALRGLQAIGKGSGHWPNLEMAVRDHRPGIAWGESLGVEEPTREDFARLLPFIAGDMANVGHKAVAVQHLGDLFDWLGAPKATGRRLLGLAAWIAATEPTDRFWNARIRKRLGGAVSWVTPGPARLMESQLLQGAREICDLGLVAMLDAFTARMKGGVREGDLLNILTLAASEKQRDARRDLEGKTSWNFVYLAALPALKDSEAWGQGAALVNFFPTDEEEDRTKAEPPPETLTHPDAALLDAILDSEPARAMGLVSPLRHERGDDSVLRVLAEAASLNDPGQNHSHAIMALAAASELLPQITEGAREAMLLALAKSLANSQGSGDLGRLADRALSGDRSV
jgi:hypothetical protein